MQMIHTLSFQLLIANLVLLKLLKLKNGLGEKNVSLNRTKSVEIVFVSPRNKRASVILPPAIFGIQRVESIKALGVTSSRKFSACRQCFLGACARTLFALHTLRHHGLPEDAIHAVYQAVICQLGGDSAVQLIEVELKRSFGDRNDSNFGLPQRHRSTLFVLRPMLSCLTISCIIDNIYCSHCFLWCVMIITVCVVGLIIFKYLLVHRHSKTITF